MQSGLTAEQVPLWLRCPHLLTNYRLGGTYWICFQSLFAWHNETVNAWTMIVTNLLSFIALCCSKCNGLNCIPFYTLWFSALVHMPFSVGYHLFSPIDQHVFNTWKQLDILFIFVSSCFLTFSLGFHVMPLDQNILVTTVAIILTCWYKCGGGHNIATNKMRNALLVSSIVCIYCIPIIYKCIIDKDILTISFAHTTLLIVVSSIFGTGLLYAKSIPERWFPGAFDLFGRSHHIMHIGVMVAHMAEWYFVYSAYNEYI